jgi:signal transduction histidine kinase/ActR/RegA family two-component response regulator
MLHIGPPDKRQLMVVSSDLFYVFTLSSPLMRSLMNFSQLSGRTLQGRVMLYLLALGLLCTLSIGGALTIHAWNTATRQAEQETQTQALYVAEVAIHNIAVATNTVSDMVRTISAEAANAVPNRATVTGYLHETLEQQPELYGTWFQAPHNAFDGRDRANSGQLGSSVEGIFSPYWIRDGHAIRQDTDSTQPTEAGIFEDAYYTEPVKAGRTVVIEPYIDTMMDGKTAVLMTTLAAHVYHKGRVIGVAGVDIDLATLSQRVAALKVRPGQKIYMFSAQGMVLAHPNAALLGKPYSTTHLPDIQNLRAHKIAKYRRNGEELLLTSISVPIGTTQTHWVVVLETPMRMITAPARDSLRLALLVTALLLIPAIAAAVALARSLTRPLTKMSDAMQSMADGNMDTLIPEVTDSELKPMARALTVFRDNHVARLSAEAASEAKSVFLAMMSHELRTPLNGVLGMSAALGNTTLDASQREMIDILENSGQGLLQILNDILDVAKIEAGQFNLLPKPFGTRTALEPTLKMFAEQARSKGIGFTYMLDDVSLDGDELRVRQVLSNLVSNAIKFTDHGSVAVSIQYRRQALRITVRDSGIGISPDAQEALFKEFSQIENASTRRFSGTGLGLSIARKLCRAMDGDITVDSTAGQGSTFTATLAIPTTAATHEPTAAEAHTDIEQQSRILVAEDNPQNRAVLKILLGQLGIEPDFAENGAEAVTAWQSGGYDLILMDAQMPVMDGMDAIRTIRKHEAADGLARTPIVMLSANAMPHQVAEHLAAGADAHAAKPVHIPSLINAMQLASEK